VRVSLYMQVKHSKVRTCMCYKGLRFKDRPKKRVILAQIIANQGRNSLRHDTFYGCKQCDVYLYKERGYFDVFHREK
jgi:hypothetical protein